MLGRTASNLYIFRGITSAVGAILIPFFVTNFGVKNTFLITGLVISTFCAVMFLALPTLRDVRIPLDKGGG